MAAPAAPKMDLKMLVLPAMLLFSKKIDLTDPDILLLVKKIFFGGVLTAFVLCTC